MRCATAYVLGTSITLCRAAFICNKAKQQLMFQLQVHVSCWLPLQFLLYYSAPHLEHSIAGFVCLQVPTDYFVLVLGPHLKYSSCLYNSSRNTLAEAEHNMLGG